MLPSPEEISPFTGILSKSLENEQTASAATETCGGEINPSVPP